MVVIQAGIKALGTANDGGAIHVAVENNPQDAGVGHGGYDKKTNTATLTINTAKLNTSAYSPATNEAELGATGMHEIKHIEDDLGAGRMPHDMANEFWHEVRGLRAETPIWEGLRVDDPNKTWTVKGGLDMKKVYDSAEWLAQYYCSHGGCP